MTAVKICGVTRVDDAVLAAELGAAAIGFNFWPDSPRFIDPHEARRIVAALPPLVTVVGVFVDQPTAYVIGVAALVPLGAVQLHGQEAPRSYARLPRRVIKTVPLNDDATPTVVDAVPAHVTILLDAHDPIRRGGTGRTIDWSLAAAVAARRRTILSGGLRPDNVGEALAQVRPYGVDVASGVEARPGIKDPVRLREFLAAVAAARVGVAPGEIA